MPRLRRWRRWLLLAALPALLYLLLLRLLQPERLGALLLERAGQASGLVFSAEVPARLGLRHGLGLDIDGLHVDTRDGQRLLAAQRLSLRLPLSVLWSAVAIDAADLEAPVLDLDAVVAWQQANRASGPPRPLAIPAAGALRVRGGRIDAGTARLDALDLDLNGLRAGDTLELHVVGVLEPAGSNALPFELALAGPVRALGESLRIEPLELVVGSPAAAPFARLSGPLDWMPPLRLDVSLAGALAGWPAAWPALPAPLPQQLPGSTLALEHHGPGDASGEIALRWRSGEQRLDLDLRWPALLDWLAAGDWRVPAPLRLDLDIPELQIDGLRIEGLRLRQDPEPDAD